MSVSESQFSSFALSNRTSQIYQYAVVCLNRRTLIESPLCPEQFTRHVASFSDCMLEARKSHIEIWLVEHRKYIPIYGVQDGKTREASEVCTDLHSKDTEEEYNKIGCMTTNLYVLWNKRVKQYRCAVAERKLAGGTFEHLLPKIEELQSKIENIHDFVAAFQSDVVKEVFDVRFREQTKLEMMPERLHLGFSTINRYLRELRLELGSSILRTWTTEEVKHLIQEYELERRNFTKPWDLCS